MHIVENTETQTYTPTHIVEPPSSFDLTILHCLITILILYIYSVCNSVLNLIFTTVSSIRCQYHHFVYSIILAIANDVI